MFEKSKSNSKNKILAATLALSLAFSAPLCTSSSFIAGATGINDSATVEKGDLSSMIEELNDLDILINLAKYSLNYLEKLGTEPQDRLFIKFNNELNDLIYSSCNLKLKIIEEYSNDSELIEQVTTAKEVYDEAELELYKANSNYNSAQEALKKINSESEDDQNESPTSEIKITKKEFKKFMVNLVEMYAENLEIAQADYDTAKKTYISILDEYIHDVIEDID